MRIVALMHFVRRLAALAAWQKVFLGLFVVIILLTFFGPQIGPYDPIKADPSNRLAPPTLTHPLGADDNGMDILSRILASPQVDVTIAVLATLISVVIGTPLGLVIAKLERRNSRFARGAADSCMRLLEVLQAFPVFVFAMVLVAIAGGSILNIIAAVAFVNVPIFVRLARSEASSLLGMPFVEAARAIGNNELQINFRHLLPNIIPTITVQISVTIGFAVLLTAGLSFVGAGVKPPTPELGSMIAQGSKYILLGQWWVVVYPAFTLGIIVFTFAVVGDILRDLLRPVTSDRNDIEAALANERTTQQFLSSIYQNSSVSPLLEIRGLSVAPERAHDRRILTGIDFKIHPGERVAIIGESGSGKTMLARSILRILPPGLHITDGKCLFCGRDIAELSDDELRKLRSKKLAAVLPNAKSQLYPLTTVMQSFVAVMQAHERLPYSEARKRCVELLRMVGINDPEERLRAYPHELSGGMAQRICLAIALMYRPRLLICDEPTQGLDVTIQRQVLDTMVEMTHETGSALLIITGDLGIAAHYADRVLVMQNGRFVEENTCADFFAAPQVTYSRLLLQAVKN
ncbi:MAG: dipeptide/oligopeptide/nickel ABC transporter permease/ATP-binding protein [Aestuariivita sp.]|nr:dipeptide/oligopeptide/nickel ABC transporter permease/ATP-binding protein [Aestuariivita sp.]MCY4203603.1 dipeptide/oligopeptide/nickel ABC transporter permease/ATP-binding protein [Aestuariivita sp.]